MSVALTSLLFAFPMHLVTFVQDETPELPPNVLLIVIDDLNDWTSGLGGHPQARTPNLDRLAAQGTSFTNAHCAAPTCNPSRTAVMTGLAPHRTGVYGGRPNFRDVLPDVITLPEHFREHGYVTLGAGKIYHKPYPDPRSWDRYFPSKEAPIAADSFKPGTIDQLGAGIDAGSLQGTDADAGDGKVATWVAEQLASQHEKPFFLACGFYRPHVPWFAPRAYFDSYPLGEIQLPSTLPEDLDDVPPMGVEMASVKTRVDDDKLTRAIQAYLASIAFVDAQVGVVLDALEAGPHANNTVVVLWSDHGYHLGEKGHWHKMTLWEESTRVPLILRTPGGKSGPSSGRPVNLLDLYPTLIEVCGIGPRPGLDGQSLVPLLKDPQAEWERPSLTTMDRGNHSLRTDRWRYIRYSDGSEELYDHSVDPNEWTNLARDPVAAEVKERLAGWLPTEDAPDAHPRSARQR